MGCGYSKEKEEDGLATNIAYYSKQPAMKDNPDCRLIDLWTEMDGFKYDESLRKKPLK